MKVAITGSHGLVGTALVEQLRQNGHEAIRLVRESADSSEVVWDPASETDELPELNGIDAAVHLAGENIASGRWTERKKKLIRSSRVDGTRNLCRAMARLENPPKVLVSASAIGYYGSRGDTLLDENCGPGAGFLPEVCREWEQATEAARTAGIRVVNLRIGIVLSDKGGALAKMLTPFRLGMGGRVGDGRQYWSWIVLDDLVRVIVHCIEIESAPGPVNAVSPQPVINAEFTKILGGVLGRPTVFPMPAFAAKLALGEMADDLLLASARVDPQRLREAGFSWAFPNLEPALRHVLSNK